MQKSKKKYYIMQKLVGILMMLFGIIVGILAQSPECVLLFAPMGAGLIFTKEKLIMATDEYWKENPVERK